MKYKVKELNGVILGGGDNYISGSQVGMLYSPTEKEKLLRIKKGIETYWPNNKIPAAVQHAFKEGNKWETPIIEKFIAWYWKHMGVLHLAAYYPFKNTFQVEELGISGNFDCILINHVHKKIVVVDAKNYKELGGGDVRKKLFHQLNLYMFIAKNKYSDLIDKGYTITSYIALREHFQPFSLKTFKYGKPTQSESYSFYENKYDPIVINEMLLRIKDFFIELNNIETINKLDSEVETNIKKIVEINKRIKELNAKVKFNKDELEKVWKLIPFNKPTTITSKWIISKISFNRKILNKSTLTEQLKVYKDNIENYYKDSITIKKSIKERR